MYLLKKRLENAIRELPTKRRPTNTHRDEEELALYLLKERREFTHKIMNKSVINDVPWCIVDIVPLVDDTNEFITRECGDAPRSYYQWCYTAPKADAATLASSVVEGLLRQNMVVRSGMSIGIIVGVQQTIVSTTIDTTIMELATDSTQATIEDYKALYGRRLTMGSTINIYDSRQWDAMRNVVVQTYLGLRSAPLKTLTTNDSTIALETDSPSARAARVELLRGHIKRGSQTFIHAPYTYNGANPKADANIVIADLRDAVSVGALGVVIHVGHATAGTSLPEEVFADRMAINIRRLLSYATATTPLLLETPPGKQNELFVSPRAFIAFYQSFDVEERKLFGLCVDTCHVWDSGYHPLTYLEYIHSREPNAIRLIHFNDSAGPCGCRNDIHFSPGGGIVRLREIVEKCQLPPVTYTGENGYIGVARLAKVAEWAYLHNIKCVEE